MPPAGIRENLIGRFFFVLSRVEKKIFWGLFLMDKTLWEKIISTLHLTRDEEFIVSYSLTKRRRDSTLVFVRNAFT